MLACALCGNNFAQGIKPCKVFGSFRVTHASDIELAWCIWPVVLPFVTVGSADFWLYISSTASRHDTKRWYVTFVECCDLTARLHMFADFDCQLN